MRVFRMRAHITTITLLIVIFSSRFAAAADQAQVSAAVRSEIPLLLESEVIFRGTIHMDLCEGRGKCIDSAQIGTAYGGFHLHPDSWPLATPFKGKMVDIRGRYRSQMSMFSCAELPPEGAMAQHAWGHDPYPICRDNPSLRMHHVRSSIMLHDIKLAE